MTAPNSAESNTEDYLPPGSWIGMLGGGQLGRMFTHAAQQMGYHVAVFETQANCPAAQAADQHFLPKDESDIEATLDELVQRCDVITLEFENVDADLVRRAANKIPAHPRAEFLELCQNRIREKGSLSEAGFPTTPFLAVQSEAEVLQAAEKLGWPLVLKTATSGYDGKGQAIVRSAEQLADVWPKLESDQIIAEQWIEFEAEVSMIAARNARGDIQCFPLFENDHENHILFVTRCPASPQFRGMELEAREICEGIASKFDVVGLFCVEFFVAKDGRLLINEIAPRPHNSGHVTMDAFQVTQFDQHVRAVCNLPLLEPEQIRPAAMVNLLGDVWAKGEPDWRQVLQHADAHLHLYGKAQAREGRKMGHINTLADDSTAAADLAKGLRQELL